jgi:hypothetical protein
MKDLSMALSIVLLATLGCARAGATKAHAHAMKPAPSSPAPDSARTQTSDTARVAPNVWELTALALRKGPSSAS